MSALPAEIASAPSSPWVQERKSVVHQRTTDCASRTRTRVRWLRLLAPAMSAMRTRSPLARRAEEPLALKITVTFA